MDRNDKILSLASEVRDAVVKKSREKLLKLSKVMYNSLGFDNFNNLFARESNILNERKLMERSELFNIYDLYNVHDKINKIVYSNNKGITVDKVEVDGYYLVVKHCSSDEYVVFDEIINEAFVGIFGLNNLNIDIFAKIIYANVQQNCPNNHYKYPEYENSKCNYVAYEFIEGKTLHDFIFEAKEDQLINIMTKLFKGLNVAHNMIGFTHYDLHNLNIMIKPNLDPVIIDYGLSYIKYGELNSGFVLKEGAIDMKPCWFHDVFKFCCNMLIRTDVDVILTKEKIINDSKKSRIVFSNDRDVTYEELLERVKIIEDGLELLQTYKAPILPPESNIFNDIIKLINKDLLNFNELKKYNKEYDEDDEPSIIKSVEYNRLVNLFKEGIKDMQGHINWAKKERDEKRVNEDILSLGPKVRKLCQFFDEKFIDTSYILKYSKTYVYYQPSVEMLNSSKKYDFDEFLSFAITTLNS